MSVTDLLLVGQRGLWEDPEDRELSDATARRDALQVDRSWIVEAPAGSGKTGLLIQRYLKLLTAENVGKPEQVLAITFTEKATAEMRERVLGHLQAAVEKRPVKERDDFGKLTRALAEAVLEKDRARGWDLLKMPSRLKIRTIDSVNAEIAGALPVLSGSGGRLQPVKDPSGLYGDAARRALMQLGGEDSTLDAALRLMLVHRDGNLGDVERLIAEMLERRQQWGELVSLARPELDDEYLDGEVLPKLERALEVAICAAMTRANTAIPQPVLGYLALLAGELGGAEGYKGGANPVAICRMLHEAPSDQLDHLDHWIALAHLLLKKDGEWRVGVSSNYLGVTIDKDQVARLKTVLGELRGDERALEALQAIGSLPPSKYPKEQWEVMKALFRILRQALIELQLVFVERSECDFAELELAALHALRDEAGAVDYAETLGMRLEHLLVDEMQDTSSGQYELIQLLTQGWDGMSQTVFLVGDPKQSIYLFRQARVERFLRTMQSGRLGELGLGRLRLTANFRSQAMLVESFNDDFSRLFPEASRSDVADVTYAAATPVRVAAAGVARAWHAHVLPRIPDADAKKLAMRRQRREDAREIRRIVEAWLARPLPAGRTDPWTIAVLVRGRAHLVEIVAEFKGDASRGAIPYRAVEIEPLQEKQIVLDLVAITRALLHPADRAAWLALLHAPWCGLGLADLHGIAGGDDPLFDRRCVEDLIEERGDRISDGGIARLQKVWLVMQDAGRQRGRLAISQWVERTWRSLGGDIYASDADLADAMRYLRLLDEIEAENGRVELGVVEGRLNKLYAEPATAGDAVDLMTIHKAKGLEWDVVIVPALERKARPSRGGLLSWVELDSSSHDAAHVVMAPIEAKGGTSKELRDWIASIRKARDAAERLRLFYVACTRAREALHLFATRGTKVNGEAEYASDSLLAAAWPAAGEHFAVASAFAGQLAEIVEVEREDGGLAIAAAEDSDVAPEAPPKIYRLPIGFDARARFVSKQTVAGREIEAARRAEFERPEGSFAARAFGNAVHGFLELAAKRLEAGVSAEALLSEIAGWVPRVETVLRGDGLPPATVRREAQRVLTALKNALGDEEGRWILGAREAASSEYSFTSWRERRNSFRLDRTFVGGVEPLRSGGDALWIVDYKTGTHGRGVGVEDFVAAERLKYGDQMESYARAMAIDVRDKEIRVGLYYPMLPKLVWWTPDI